MGGVADTSQGTTTPGDFASQVSGVHRAGPVPGQKPAARHAPGVAAGAEQAQVQPEFILARFKQAPRRRESELLKPGLSRSGQLFDFLLSLAGAATEPLRNEGEDDGLQAAQFGRMERAPFGPEGIVAGVRIQETGYFISVKGTAAAAQNMFEVVQRGEAQRVGSRKARKIELRRGDARYRAALPEIFDARRGKAFPYAVPEPKMDLDGQGRFGIEEIAAKFPAGLADQRGEMVGREVFDAFERVVTGGQQEIAGRADGFARNEEVHVILRPVLGLKAEQRALSEALEGHELDGLAGECLGEPAVQLD